MPLFLFHLRTPAGLDPDDTGLDFPDLDAAYLEACATIPAMAADLVRRCKNPIPYAFVIADTAGTELMEVPFAERLDDGRPPSRPDRRRSYPRVRETLARTRQLIGEIQAQTEAMAASARASLATAQRSREILRER